MLFRCNLEFLVLSFIDAEAGPQILLTFPEVSDIQDLEKVPILMKNSTDGFFSHFFDNFKTVNRVFKIASEWARGEYESLMISIVLSEEDIDLDLARAFLERFIKNFQKIPNAFKALYLDSKSYTGDPALFEEIRRLLEQTYADFPKEIVELKEYVTPIDVSLIFAAWHESIGVDFLVAYPPDQAPEPEINAIRCIATGSFVFGSVDFKPTSFILPFHYLHAKVGIFFDYVLDTSVRGGRKPLMLATFFNEQVPSIMIEQFMEEIAEQFAEFKLRYKNKTIVEQYLKKIHEFLTTKLSADDPVIQALQHAENRYQMLFKTARDAILILEKNKLVIIDANDQAALLFQQPLETMIGISLSQLQPPIVLNSFTEKIMQQISSPEIAPFEMNLIATGGVTVPVEISAGELQINRQKVIQCIIRDSSSRKILEAEAQENEEKFRLAFEYATDAIFWSDVRTGKITNCNKAAEELLDVGKEELIGKSLTTIFPPKLAESYASLFDELVEGHQITDKSARVLSKTGKVIPVHISAGVALIGKDLILQGIYRNISEHQKIQPLFSIA